MPMKFLALALLPCTRLDCGNDKKTLTMVGSEQHVVNWCMRLMQAAVSVALLAWKKPEALRPSNVAAVVTAPGRAAVGWAQETLIPPGPQLPIEDARSLVLQWQAIKAQSMGAWPAHLP